MRRSQKINEARAILKQAARSIISTQVYLNQKDRAFLFKDITAIKLQCETLDNKLSMIKNK